jgi:hypothetical protein
MEPPVPKQRLVRDATVLYPASLRDLLLRCAECIIMRQPRSMQHMIISCKGPIEMGSMRPLNLRDVRMCAGPPTSVVPVLRQASAPVVVGAPPVQR